MAQRKHVIPHSAMKNNRNTTECCHSTHQGAPRSGKKRALALRTWVTLVTLLVDIAVCRWKLMTLSNRAMRQIFSPNITTSMTMGRWLVRWEISVFHVTIHCCNLSSQFRVSDRSAGMISSRFPGDIFTKIQQNLQFYRHLPGRVPECQKLKMVG